MSLWALWVLLSLFTLLLSGCVVRLKGVPRIFFALILSIVCFAVFILNPFFLSNQWHIDWVNVLNPCFFMGQQAGLDLAHADFMYRHTELANVFVEPASWGQVLGFYLTIIVTVLVYRQWEMKKEQG